MTITHDFTNLRIGEHSVTTAVFNCIDSIEPTDEPHPVNVIVKVDMDNTYLHSFNDTYSWMWALGKKLSIENSYYRIVDYSVQHMHGTEYHVTILLRPVQLGDIVNT